MQSILCIILASISMAQITLAHPHDLSWRYSGTSEDLYAAAFDGGETAIVVGEKGTILRSIDTVHWSPVQSGTALPLRSAAHGANLFVAVGGQDDQSILLTSPNGIEWSSQPLPTNSVLRGVTFGAGRFVCVGDHGLILTSTDATHWSVRLTGLDKTLRAVTCGRIFENSIFESSIRDLFVVVGDNGSLFTSFDGLAWTYRSSGTLLDIQSVSSIDLRRSDTPAFIAVGRQNLALVSSDGLAWTAISLPVDGSYNAVSGAGAGGNGATGIYGVVGDAGTYLTSNDNYARQPLTLVGGWNERSAHTDEDLLGILHIYGGFLAVGRQGTIRAGFTWRRRAPSTTNHLHAGIFNADRWIVVGENGALLTSPDTLTWTAQATGTSSTLRSIACGDGTCVAVGDDMTAVVSKNRGPWINVTLPISPEATYPQLDRVIYGHGTFVAVASHSEITNTLYWSQDGLAWEAATNISPVSYGDNNLTFGNDLFLFRAGPDIYYSGSAVDWTKQPAPFNFNLIQFLNDKFFGFTSSLVGSSYHGLTWHVEPSGIVTPTTDAAHVNGLMLTVGSLNGIDSLALSEDGTAWAQAVLNEPHLLNSRVSALVQGPHSVVALGRDGVLFESAPRFADPVLYVEQIPIGINLIVVGEPNSVVRIDKSSNLQWWEVGPPIVLTNQITTYFPFPPQSCRFFRAIPYR